MNNLIKAELKPGHIILVTQEEAEKYNLVIVKEAVVTKPTEPEKNKAVKPQANKGE